MAKIKGAVIVSSIKQLVERNGELKFSEIVELLGDPSRKTFSDKIFATSWYPLDAFVQFLAGDVKLTAGGIENTLVRRTEHLMDGLLRSTYRSFAGSESTAFIVNGLVAVHKSLLFDVAMDVQATDIGQAVITYSGFEPQHRILGHVLNGFFRKALEVAGATTVNVVVRTAAPDNGDHWTVDLRWQD